MSLRTAVAQICTRSASSPSPYQRHLLHTTARVLKISEDGFKLNDQSSSSGGESSRSAAEQRRLLDELRRGLVAEVNKQQAESILKGTAPAGGVPNSMGLGLGSSIYSAPSKRPRGLIQKATGEGKSWSELKAGQKVARGTQKTYQFSLVVGGAVLVTLIVVALGSELYAPNSPTVIFKDACRRIEDSEEVSVAGRATKEGEAGSGGRLLTTFVFGFADL